jgi:hypothetical protein
MKLTALSQSIRTIGVMAMFSIAVIPHLTKTAQAQSSTPQARSSADLARDRVCTRVFKELGETVDNQTYYDDFKGLNLTDRQKKSEQALNAKKDAKITAVSSDIISVPESLTFSAAPGVSIPPTIQATIDKVNNSRPEVNQAAALDRKFGKYGRFIIGSYLNYYATPNAQAKLDKISQDYYTQLENIMTPAQKPQYRKNLAGRLKINAVCDTQWPHSGSAMGKISDKAPGTK